jgi:hypothetical protein
MNSTTQIQENQTADLADPLPVCLIYLRKNEKTIPTIEQ